MPISRSQMERQLRNKGGIMNAVPRQGYFLGGIGDAIKGAVKGVAKGISGLIKSPLGKAALIGGGLFGVPGTQFGGLLGKGSLANIIGQKAMTQAPFAEGTGIMGKIGSFFGGEKTLGKTAKVFAGGTALGAVLEAAGLGQEEQEELASTRNIDALKSYLRKGYKNLNPDAGETEIETFVEENTREYAARGGRMGYNQGTGDPTYTGNNPEDLPRGLKIDTTTSAYGDAGKGRPVPESIKEGKSLKENLQYLNKIKGGVSPRTKMFMLKNYMDKALRSGEISKGQYEKMIMPLFGEMSEKVTKQIADYEREDRAYGGRMKYAKGTDQIVDQASGIMGLPKRVNEAGVKELDLRKSGGFIPPVGIKEKADDIPAMLSNNEFVFTADAVRGMGGGDVNKGAQRLYDQMKTLENKVV